jgi:hypothetical protein
MIQGSAVSDTDGPQREVTHELRARALRHGSATLRLSGPDAPRLAYRLERHLVEQGFATYALDADSDFARKLLRSAGLIVVVASETATDDADEHHIFGQDMHTILRTIETLGILANP